MFWKLLTKFSISNFCDTNLGMNPNFCPYFKVPNNIMFQFQSVFKIYNAFWTCVLSINLYMYLYILDCFLKFDFGIRLSGDWNALLYWQGIHLDPALGLKHKVGCPVKLETYKNLGQNFTKKEKTLKFSYCGVCTCCPLPATIARIADGSSHIFQASNLKLWGYNL